MAGLDWASILLEAFFTVATGFLVGWILLRADNARNLNQGKIDALVDLRTKRFQFVGLLLRKTGMEGFDVAAHRRDLDDALRELWMARDKYAFIILADRPRQMRALLAGDEASRPARDDSSRPARDDSSRPARDDSSRPAGGATADGASRERSFGSHLSGLFSEFLLTYRRLAHDRIAALEKRREARERGEPEPLRDAGFDDAVYSTNSAFDKALARHYFEHTRYGFFQVLFGRTGSG